MTLTLTLQRHAKSSWDDAIPRDFDRPLNKRGEKAAVVPSANGRRKMPSPSTMSSPAPPSASLTPSTSLCVGSGERIDATWDRRIYLASSATLMDVLRDQSDEHKSVLMVGHNPGMEDLVFDIVPR